MLYPLLHFGSHSPFVKLLQLSLNEALSSPIELTADGIFGQKTLAQVRSFQSNQGLVADGYAGPKTHAELETYYVFLKYLVSQLTPPKVQMARQTIRTTALAHHAQWGWLQPSTDKYFVPLEFSPRIAAGEWSNPNDDRVSKRNNLPAHPRQGGLSLQFIFQLAGVHAECDVLTEHAWKLYHTGKMNANARNSHDIPSWCGIFVTYIYITSGLKIQSWRPGGGLNYPPPFSRPKKGSAAPDFFLLKSKNLLQSLQPGDVGIASPSGRNHHFLITDILGRQLHTVDGNAGNFQSIIRREYNVQSKKDAYLTNVIASKGKGIIEEAAFLTPNWDKLI